VLDAPKKDYLNKKATSELNHIFDSTKTFVNISMWKMTVIIASLRNYSSWCRSILCAILSSCWLPVHTFERIVCFLLITVASECLRRKQIKNKTAPEVFRVECKMVRTIRVCSWLTER